MNTIELLTICVFIIFLTTLIINISFLIKYPKELFGTLIFKQYDFTTKFDTIIHGILTWIFELIFLISLYILIKSLVTQLS